MTAWFGGLRRWVRQLATPHRLRVVVAVAGVAVLSTITSVVLVAEGATVGDEAVPLTDARREALATAAQSCPALTPARLAGQIMATTGFSTEGGIAGLTDAEWETWKPWDDAAPDDEAANILALAHLTCDLVGNLRQDGFPGDQWPLAVAAFASSLADVRTAGGVPAAVADYVERVEAYTDWYAEQLEGPRSSPTTTAPVTGTPTTSSPASTPAATTATTTEVTTPPATSSTRSNPTTVSVPATTTAPPAAALLSLDYARFDDASGLYLNGSARIANGRLELTTGLQQAGSAWARTTIDTQKSFTTSFSAVISVPTDGLALVVQAQGPTAVGGAGGGIGYGGLIDEDPPSFRIRPSVAIEIDTWPNSRWDPPAQHLAVVTDGDVMQHHAWADPGFDMRNNQPFYVWVTYEARTHRLSVYASTSGSRPASPLFTHVIDLRDHLGTDRAYLGLTAGTGQTNLTNSSETVLSWSASSS